MFFYDLLKEWPRDRSFSDLLKILSAASGSRVAVTGLDGSSRTFFLAGLAAESRRPVLVVAPDVARAERIYEDLLSFLPSGLVNLLPARELFMAPDLLARSMEQRRQRLSFLEWLRRGEKGIYVAPFAALISRVLPPEEWSALQITLQAGAVVDRDKFLEKLIDRGYERVSLIEGRGQCSARGEIVDIFPPGWELPLRIELFDRTVESLRLFDPASQRSTEHLRQASVPPAYELILPRQKYLEGEKRIEREVEQAVSRLRRKGEVETAVKLKTNTGRHLERLAGPGGLDLLPGYFKYFYGDGASILDYLSPESVMVIDEPAALFEQAAALRRDLLEHHATAFTGGELLPGRLDSFWEMGELLARYPGSIVALTLFSSSSGPLELTGKYQVAGKNAAYYHGQWPLLLADFKEWRAEGYRIAFTAANPERAGGLQQLLREKGLSVNAGSKEPWAPGEARMTVSALQEGFQIPSLRLAVVTESNLLPRRRKRRRLAQQEGLRLRDYRELAVGDYVVHEQHGIGRYMGLSALEIDGIRRDYLLVQYRGTDRLYIPVEQIDLIQKYIGSEGKAPRLHSLGSGEWHRVKSRAKESVHQMAQELLDLYAYRAMTPGYSYGPDHPWQLEFESSFPYEETPDQLQAIAEVKRDLENEHPMDRLICGDVGYGKTEVALRAAFKVVMEGKQVALLVPTTVLAQQHYRTFSERFADYPFRVARLSRFVSPAEQKKTLEDLAVGKIDIIIGTHRLLSDDIRFHDLGLLIIDEEQRFGVRHKEKLKGLRLSVDVLAMTATPIPRTMHLSLAGVRDLSVIETPPENRYPVQTFVAEYSEHLVREAIQRELNRDGQVYFVFNRIAGIRAVAKKVQDMFPDTAVAVAHGRMPESSLEQIMSDFIEGKYRILVSTTIIEAGLDIPNVNTLVVYDADQFGLAQLYQLRGRVGRSHRPAYAYLTYRPDKIITESAKKRLQAIKEFTELGSGFKVALRDLEIRGAGNILGAEQHGFMVEIGFDLYCRLLEEAVAKIKNLPPRQEEPQPRLELKVNAYLPASYITNQDQKIDFYRRIYTLVSVEELREVEEEMRDRYGALPPPVKNLLEAASLRLLARRLGIASLHQRDGAVEIIFLPDKTFKRFVARPAAAMQRRVSFNAGPPARIKFKAGSQETVLPELIHFLEELGGEVAGMGMDGA
ncbi:MAG TPA: transcription-repair coupling factor [Bacillota bacterium]|jgi:transcription-repair coupling factor (superfamily II helicase)|nr:transcription-repair coupling factor [Bacillota bacterium]HOA34905.1 transcription-repair coupling factor [Bacillota bacterium]HPZ10755.1 transcription-repair coupling factor [Bacillota bacterium]